MKRIKLTRLRSALLLASLTSLPAVVSAQYTLQLLHASDLEGGVAAIENAPRFAAIVDTLEGTYPNSILLSAGDNYIPGPFFSAAADLSLRQPLRDFYDSYYGGIANNTLREGVGRVDISIMNALGFDASVMGNHEFDAGPATVASIIGAEFSGAEVRWAGAQFPYLSANLDYSSEASLSGLFTSTIEDVSFFTSNPNSLLPGEKKSLAPAALIERGGELIGVLGATTPLLESITSAGQVQVQGPGAGTNDMAALASILQPVIDDLLAAGANKIILVTQLQQIQFEEELITLLTGVDIVIAGGSDSILANEDDVLKPGDADVVYAEYPIVTAGADGAPALVLSTDGEYNYVGRLVVAFDDAGVLDVSSITEESGPYATLDAVVEELYGDLSAAYLPGSKGQAVQSLIDAVSGVIVSKDSNTFGSTAVFLEGRREAVRREETNLGNFTADANLWFASQVDSTVSISIKNGGGIRAAIGEIVQLPDGSFSALPPQANALSGKATGEISQLDIENSMRFNNGLTLLSLTAEGLLQVLEHGVSAWAPDATPGSFAQVGGVRFSFDPALPANDRIQNALVVGASGTAPDTLALNGMLYGDPERLFRVVTLNFLASGGDSYPFPSLANEVQNLVGNVPPAIDSAGVASFAAAGSEQDAFAEYTAAFFQQEAFNLPETPIAFDGRIQNLSLRSDAIFEAPAEVNFEEEYVSAVEASGSIFIAVTVNNPRTDSVLVGLLPSPAGTAVLGEHYNYSAGQLAAPGTSTLLFEVTLLDDEAEGGRFIAFGLAPNEGVSAGELDLLTVLIADNDKAALLPAAEPAIAMSVLNSLTPADESSSEIAAYDAASQRLFVTNAVQNQLFIYDVSDLSVTNVVAEIDISPFGGSINSVDVHSGLVAIAVEAEETGANGSVVFLTTDGAFVSSVEVGFLPDMLTFTSDGSKVLTANEGEPNDDYSIDPIGSISIIDLTGGAESLSQADVAEAGFDAFNSQASALIASGVRIFGPGASVAQDLEPEYIALSADNATAYVTLQENNALAVVDVASASVTAVLPLGYKDHAAVANQLDASDRGDAIFFAAWNGLKGSYMPDAIAAFTVDGVSYLITANEGDAREYEALEEEERVDDLELDPSAFPYAEVLQREELLGRLNVTTQNGDTDGDGDYDELYAFGGRSFTIWNAATGELVFDSGDKLECAVASDPTWAAFFNSNDDELELKSRSDSKGPEPEGVAVAEIAGRTYAFVILERIGGVMAWDVTNPASPQLVQYLNNRSTVDGEVGDLAPEGIIFVPAAESPNGQNLLFVSNEVSGTVTIIAIDAPLAESCSDYRYFLADHVAQQDTSSIYSVVLAEGEAQLELLTTCASEVHLAYNENDGLLYAVRKSDGAIKTLDPAAETPAFSEFTLPDFAFSQITQAVFNSQGFLLLSSSNADETYAVNVGGDFSVQLIDGYSPVEGGDLAFTANGAQLLMATREGGGGLYALQADSTGADSFLAALPADVTGLATMANGNFLISANGNQEFVVKTASGMSLAGIPITLGGLPYTLNDGDLAAGCADEELILVDACSPTAVIDYSPGPRIDGMPIDDSARLDPSKALGEPQIDNSLNFVSLGYGGSLTLSFEQAAFNGPGADLLVVETTYGPVAGLESNFEIYPESAQVLVSQNGVDFYAIGEVTTDEQALLEIDAAGQGFDYITAIKFVDNTPEGSVSWDGLDVDGVVALNGCGVAPISTDAFTADVSLSSQPNPSQGQTQVWVQPAASERATVEVYDVNGRKVALLYSGELQAGQQYHFNFDATTLPSGVYLVRYTSASRHAVHKVLVSR